VEELRDVIVIADEWAATSLLFIRKLTLSLPKRFQAVIGESKAYKVLNLD
jgi:hypothetical protein